METAYKRGAISNTITEARDLKFEEARGKDIAH